MRTVEGQKGEESKYMFGQKVVFLRHAMNISAVSSWWCLEIRPTLSSEMRERVIRTPHVGGGGVRQLAAAAGRALEEESHRQMLFRQTQMAEQQVETEATKTRLANLERDDVELTASVKTLETQLNRYVPTSSIKELQVARLPRY